MVVFLLLLILAILLFGSSKVLGVIGAVLGSITLVLALFFGLYAVASAMNLTVDDIILPGGIGMIVLTIAAWIILSAIEQRRIARIDAELADRLAEIRSRR